jgi:hypothetical protein
MVHLDHGAEAPPQRPSALSALLVRLYLVATIFGLLFLSSSTRPFPTIFFISIAALFLIPSPSSIAGFFRTSLTLAQRVHTLAAAIAVAVAIYEIPWGNDFWINVFAGVYVLAIFCWMQFFWPKRRSG